MNRVAAVLTAFLLSGCAGTQLPLHLFGPPPARAVAAAPVQPPISMPVVAPAPVGMPAAPVVPTPRPETAAVAENDAPSIVRAGKRMYCVQYARERSGIDIHGDARTWWRKAKGIYPETKTPEPGSVLVFAGSKRIRKGHVAVVTAVVSNREIRVDHANWMSDGRIYLNAPVVDVSANNDWSRVRVWDTRDGTLGAHVYPVKGFLMPQESATD